MQALQNISNEKFNSAFAEVQSTAKALNQVVVGLKERLQQIQDVVNQYNSEADFTNHVNALGEAINNFFDNIIKNTDDLGLEKEKIEAEKKTFADKINNLRTQDGSIDKANELKAIHEELNIYLKDFDKTLQDTQKICEKTQTKEGLIELVQDKKGFKQSLSELLNNPFSKALIVMSSPVLLPLLTILLGVAVIGGAGIVAVAIPTVAVASAALASKDAISKTVDSVGKKFKEVGLHFKGEGLEKQIMRSQTIITSCMVDNNNNIKAIKEELEETDNAVKDIIKDVMEGIKAQQNREGDGALSKRDYGTQQNLIMNIVNENVKNLSGDDNNKEKVIKHLVSYVNNELRLEKHNESLSKASEKESTNKDIKNATKAQQSSKSSLKEAYEKAGSFVEKLKGERNSDGKGSGRE